jgi:hypothetical protein
MTPEKIYCLCPVMEKPKGKQQMEFSLGPHILKNNEK